LANFTTFAFNNQLATVSLFRPCRAKAAAPKPTGASVIFKTDQYRAAALESRRRSIQSFTAYFRAFPKSGDVWPEDDRKLWLELLEGSFRPIYKDKLYHRPPAMLNIEKRMRRVN
jgi:hypothetical protein